MAVAERLELPWNFFAGFGDQCNRRYAKPLSILLKLETPIRLERISSVLQTEAQPLYQGVIETWQGM
jgi:hypothetical protein